MSFAFGLRNGFCFGVDFVSVDGDLVIQHGRAYIWDGIAITFACFHVLIGHAEDVELEDE